MKEMYLDRFAEAFAEVGLAALVFDNRNFGASDGTPRFEIDPWASDFIAGLRASLDQDRDARFAGQPPAMLPVVNEDPLGSSALPTPDSYQWFTETGRTRAPAWRNEVTLRMVELLMEYEPGAYIERVAPTPLLMVVAAGDHLTPSDLALEAYNRALEPKRLEVLPGGHFEAYVGAGFQQASRAARDWFVEHLQASRVAAPSLVTA